MKDALSFALDELAERIARRVVAIINEGSSGKVRAGGLIPRKDVATLMHRSASTMWRLEQSGVLQAVRINGRVYYRTDQVNNLMAGKAQVGGEDSPLREAGTYPQGVFVHSKNHVI